MLPPRIDAAASVAHAQAIRQHRTAHHRASVQHKNAHERCKVLEAECKALRDAEEQREKALQDALKLLSMTTRSKQTAERQAKKHKRHAQRTDARKLLKRGPVLPSAVKERLRVMRVRCEALETALHRKDRRCAFLERCLARTAGGGSEQVRAVEESDRAARLAVELDKTLRQLDDRSALAPPPPTPSPPWSARRRSPARSPARSPPRPPPVPLPASRMSPRKSPARGIAASRVLSPRKSPARRAPAPASPRSVARAPLFRVELPANIRALEEPSPGSPSLSLEELAGLEL